MQHSGRSERAIGVTLQLQANELITACRSSQNAFWDSGFFRNFLMVEVYNALLS